MISTIPPSDPPPPLPGVKPRWPLVFGLMGVAALLAAVAIGMQYRKIEALRADLSALEDQRLELQQQKEGFASRLQKVEQDLENAQGNLQDIDAASKRCVGELEDARKRGRIEVTRPLQVKVERSGFLSASRLIEWKMAVRNRGSTPANVTLKLYCLAPQGGKLARWEVPGSFGVPDATVQPGAGTLLVNSEYCSDPDAFLIVAFARQEDGTSFPIDLWPASP